MIVLIAGSSGYLGQAFTAALEGSGHQVRHLLRPSSETDETGPDWRPEAGELDPAVFDGVDAVVNVCGVSIDRRWTPRSKQLMRASRVDTTRLLAETMAQRAERPQVLLCASAVGYYGSRGDDVLTEDEPAGSGFLATLVRDWEAAADPARDAGIRVVHTRFAPVLGRSGGILARMALPFRLGVGGRLGSGRQYMSWVTLRDVQRIVVWALESPGASGAYNVCSPTPVTNAEFTRALAHVVRRPAVLPVPTPALKLALGSEMVEEALLGSVRAVPARLEQAGQSPTDVDLEAGLRWALGRKLS